MEHLIQQYLDVGDAQAMEEDQVVDLLESHLEEEMAQVEREEEVRRTQAQEQMFEHSQALHAHQRQQQSSNNATGVAIQETSFNPSTSQQHGSLLFGRQNSGGAAITQDQLTSALANAMNNTGASPSTSRHSHSPLTSLNFTQKYFYCLLFFLPFTGCFTAPYIAPHQASPDHSPLTPHLLTHSYLGPPLPLLLYSPHRTLDVLMQPVFARH